MGPKLSRDAYIQAMRQRVEDRWAGSRTPRPTGRCSCEPFRC